MKRILFIPVLLALSFFAISCSQEQDSTNVIPDDNIVTLTRDIDLGVTRAGVAVAGSVSATFNLANSQVLSYKVSTPVLNSLGLTTSELDVLIREELGSYYYVLDGNSSNKDDFDSEKNPFTVCITTCNDKYKNESNWLLAECKACCWLDRMERTLNSLTKAISIAIPIKI